MSHHAEHSKALVCIVFCVMIWFWTGGIANAGPSGYAFTDIGTLGGAETVATAINDGGQVVGQSWITLNGMPFIWSSSTGMTSLNIGPGLASVTSINNHGQIVGAMQSNIGPQAFIWQNGTLTMLAKLKDGGATAQTDNASAINDAGVVAGFSDNAVSGQPGQAVIWTTPTSVTDIGAVAGTASSAADAINDNGQVAGFAGTNQNTSVILWQDSTHSQNLGTLDSNLPISLARGINASGEVVGFGYISDDATAAFVSTGGGQIQSLPLLGMSDEALAINNDGSIVGYEVLPNGTEHAVLWQDGSVYDLNSFLPAGSNWRLSKAVGINNLGQIVGTGYIGADTTDVRSFVLTPVPDPTLAPMFVLAILGSALWRPRRAHSIPHCGVCN